MSAMDKNKTWIIFLEHLILFNAHDQKKNLIVFCKGELGGHPIFMFF